MSRPLHRVVVGVQSLTWSRNMQVTVDKNSRASHFADIDKELAVDDPDITPKAPKQVPRIMSAGAFLKKELHRGSADSDVSINLSQLNAQGERLSPPKIPERRLSKSKTFFSNFKSRKDKEPKPAPRTTSVTSNNTLIRRLSRSSKRNSICEATNTDSIPSADSSYSLDGIHGEDIADFVVDSRKSSYHHNSSHSRKSECSQNRSDPRPQSLVLCPEVKITPEVLTLDGGSVNLWVAVEISGVLRLANGSDQTSTIFQEARGHVVEEKRCELPLKPNRYSEDFQANIFISRLE